MITDSTVRPVSLLAVRGKERVDDRRVISGILHVIKSGCWWNDCPPEYGPATTIYKGSMPLSSAGRAASSNACGVRPRKREIGSSEFAE